MPFWEEYPTLKREEVRSALGSFMFSQEEVMKKMGQLSGGEKVRLALCKMFQAKPNLLILDEPTNHMDILGKQALEQMLQAFPGTGNAPTLQDVFDKKTYYNPGKIKSRLLKQLEKFEKQLSESEEKADSLQLQLLDPALASDYHKLMELQTQLEEEEHQQETLLARMLETETELHAVCRSDE